MKGIVKKMLSAGLMALVLITGCKNPPPESEKAVHSGIPVEVSHVHTGPLATYTELNATSAFLFKASVKAPVTGYIDNISVNQGDLVEKSQLLFKILTKEAMALIPDSSVLPGFRGIVEVRAATAGIISSVEHSAGDYVSESDQLCQIAVQNSFVFILDVPFELSDIVKLNGTCEIFLPDSQRINGIIRSELPSVSGNSQTRKYIVRPGSPARLPENLSARVRIMKFFTKEAVTLPESSILTDETMKEFWVMKLINDTTAVRINITPGIKAGKIVQIIKPQFNNSDLFLTAGNYGLGDTAYVKVIKTDDGE